MGESDEYEERLKEVFNSFDASGAGFLSPEELSDLCLSLHLGDATPDLLHALLQSQDHVTARVDFEQFKNALIVVLSSNLEQQQVEEESLSKPESPEIQPKFVKGSKRYGRRSTPEFIEPVTNPEEEEEEEAHVENNDDSAVPRKRERWNAHDTSTEEYEAEGQMHLWNPDEPSTPRRAGFPPSTCLDERLRDACDELEISWEGSAGHTDLLALCEHLSLEVNVDVLQTLSGDGVMNVQEFVSRVVNHNKPPTPSASTPYRQLKRHHSTQPFDEGGRRIATPSALTSTIGMRLFSTLDDGTGFTPVEYILDAWMEEGIENSTEILQALNFNLDGKLSLGELTMALENELLVAKNGIHQAALASFKAEIRYLLERVDRERREKEKIQSDLEKAEKLKTQLATEVDERHSAIEHMNNLNLRKLEQDHKEKLASVRSELMNEMDQMQQQAGLQREQLEAEVEKIREDESFLRDHLSISVKENRRLEMELLDSSEKLVEAQSQNKKLQTILDNVMKEKFGDLDPGSADFLLQEERIKELRSGYEAQYRELQDRIDELQSELQEFHSLGRVHPTCHKPLSEELESKSPGMESDPGIGSEEVQPFNMTLEAEMMLEQLKEQHLQEMEELRNQLESKISEFDKLVGKQRSTHDEQQAALALRYQEEVQALREEMSGIQSHQQELQSQLEQAELERTRLGLKQAQEREELENLQEEEVGTLRQQLLEAHTCAADMEEQLKTLEAQQTAELDELREQHAAEIKKLGEEHVKLCEARLEEEREKLQEEMSKLEKRLLNESEREKEMLQQRHEEELKARLEEEREELERRLTEQWQKERAQLDEQNNDSLQVVLEEEMLRLVREHEEKEGSLREQWESERARLQERHEEALLHRALQERSQVQEEFEQRESKLREEWEREKLQLEEDYEGMLQERLNEEREKVEAEKEEEEKRVECLLAEEKARMEANHSSAMKELMLKHTGEMDALSSMLDKLRKDIAQERSEIQSSFSQRLEEVESRFSGDQESVAERFQADVLKLEQHYQSELKALSESHVVQKHQWEVQTQEALENAEEQRKETEEAAEREKKRLYEEWTTAKAELEGRHQEEMKGILKKNQQLQNELDSFISQAQTKEIALSRQLNDLHNRLQGSLETKDQLLAQSETKAFEAELLLNQAAEDFKREREELLQGQSEAEAKYNEMLSISERQSVERIELLTQCDNLKVKIEELELLLKQAAADFELERKELREQASELEETLEDNQEVDREELLAERETLKMRIKELEMMCSQSKGDGIKQNLPKIYLNNQTFLDYVEDLIEAPDAVDGDQNEYDGGDGVLEVPQIGDSSPEVICSDEPESRNPDSPPDNGSHSTPASRNQAVSSPEGVDAGEDGENKAALESCEEENKSPDVQTPVDESLSHEKQRRHESVADAAVLEETSDPDEPDAEVQNCVEEEGEGEDGCAHDHLDEEHSLFKLQALYNTSIEESILLHEKIFLLQQKTEILENLLAHNAEKIRSGRQILEENYSLKVKVLLLMEHIKELELKALKVTELQIRYEDCVCENAKLKDQNGELEKRVWSLESRMNHFHDFQDQQVGLADEISRMRAENMKLSELCSELERKDGGFEKFLTDEVLAVTDLEDSCEEFEKHNTKLRRAITELQDKSQSLNETTHAHSSEASRLAEENVALRRKITVLKEEDLKEVQEELVQTLEHLKKGKLAAQKAAENFNKRISELHVQSQQLEDENGLLSEKNAQNVSDMQILQQQLAQQIRENERRETFTAEEKNKLAACVSALEAELTEALEETAQLQQRNSQLSQQLTEKVDKVVSVESQLSHLEEEQVSADKERQGLCSQLAKAQERVKMADETLQAVNHQSARLKSDLRVVQQERDFLKHEVTVLQKQLQNINDKNHVLEMTLHSSGLQSQNKKLYRDEMSRLMDQEQQILSQENERLQAEVRSVKGDLVQSREKVRQLDATVVSLKQHKHQAHSSLLKALEQENASLKQELEAQKELTKGCEAGQGHAELEELQQENEALRAQMTRLSTQLLETFQAQLVGLLPPSPHRMPRGQPRGDDPGNMQQDERERKMKIMEERMREIELSLRNVKLLLKEKVAQLKDQLHKNGKADVLIKDLYEENTQLLKALEVTEQRQKITEKKNYLLEEKISSLNKIVRDLNPSPLTSLPYHYKCT